MNKNPSRISTSKLKTHINKMLAYCFNPQLTRDYTIEGVGSTAANQNQARLKYRFYLQFLTSEFHNLSCILFKNDIFFQNSFAL